MQTHIWLSFIGASVIFGLVPGPSVCFTIAYSLRYGTRRTLSTIAGQLTANGFQIIIVLFGMSGIFERSALFFEALKLCGAVYLVYLGIRQWTAGKPHASVAHKTDAGGSGKAFLDGFVVCGINPKAILYYAALLPQFVVGTGNVRIQMIVLSMTSVVIAALILMFYTFAADGARRWFFKDTFWKLQNRLVGVLMMVAGVVLSVASRK